MKLTKKSVRYELEHGDRTLTFAVHEWENMSGRGGRLSMYPLKGDKFWFEHSNPEKVAEIAELMLEAARIAKKEKF